MIKKRARLDPRIMLMIGVFFTSTSTVMMRFATAPALAIATLRMLFTVLLLTPWTLGRNFSEIKKLRLSNIAACAASGFFLALHFWFVFEAVRYTSVAVANTLASTECIFVAIGFALFMKGHISRLGSLAIFITFCGSAIIALGAGGDIGSLVGAAFALASGLLVAGYTLIGRAQRGTLSTATYTWATYLSSAVVLVLLCVFTQTPIIGLPVRNYAVSLGMAVFCTLLGHSVFSWCLKYLTPASVSFAKLSTPLFSCVIAFLLLSEVPAPMQVGGAGVVLAGLVLYNRAEKSAALSAKAAGVAANAR